MLQDGGAMPAAAEVVKDTTTQAFMKDVIEESKNQPVLVDFPIGNATVPALLAPTKRGEIFVLDRRSGKPLTKVVERAAPQGPPQGDRLSPTQPYSVGFPSFAPADLIARFREEAATMIGLVLRELGLDAATSRVARFDRGLDLLLAADRARVGRLYQDDRQLHGLWDAAITARGCAPTSVCAAPVRGAGPGQVSTSDVLWIRKSASTRAFYGSF